MAAAAEQEGIAEQDEGICKLQEIDSNPIQYMYEEIGKCNADSYIK
jgi:hypothetical protein